MSSKPRQESTSLPSQGHFALGTLAALAAFLAVILALYTPLRSAFPSQISHLFARSTLSPSIQRSMATTTTTMASATPLQITKRPWNARGHADHGWLYTFHTFSFASYHDRAFESFGPLRVINEDRVARGTGFGAHPHAEFLIWSYLVRGELEHRDSLGHVETLRRGEVQFTNAGTGIRHSEYNRNESADTHFLQIWAKPGVRGLEPSYCTRAFPDERKTDVLLRVMESEARHSGREAAGEPIPMHADLSMSASILSPGKKVVHELVEEGERKVYLHVVMSDRTQPASGGARIKIGDEVLGEGDGAFVRGAIGPGKIEVESVGDKPAEFLLFDMGE